LFFAHGEDLLVEHALVEHFEKDILGPQPGKLGPGTRTRPTSSGVAVVSECEKAIEP